MMNQVYKTLPDDRPITSLCVVEDIEKCPKGYVAVSRTHDQDSDADLWRESGFFGRKCTRYICLSKTEGTPDYVVQSVAIINEKEVPPQGYNTLTKTFDTAQKAWRKKQLCYKFAHKSTSPTAVTDIIVLSRMKKAPEEFTLSGEINGMTLCYKVGKSCVNNGIPVLPQPQIPYSLLPNRNVQTTSPNSTTSPTYQNITLSKSSGSGAENGNNKNSALYSHEYEMLSPLAPMRPAPKPPVSTYATMSGFNGLEGVPFVLNPKWSFSSDNTKSPLVPKLKTKAQIDQEYSYEFRTERETLKLMYSARTNRKGR